MKTQKKLSKRKAKGFTAAEIRQARKEVRILSDPKYLVGRSLLPSLSREHIVMSQL